jgi:hypothetical protein
MLFAALLKPLPKEGRACTDLHSEGGCRGREGRALGRITAITSAALAYHKTRGKEMGESPEAGRAAVALHRPRGARKVPRAAHDAPRCRWFAGGIQQLSFAVTWGAGRAQLVCFFISRARRVSIRVVWYAHHPFQEIMFFFRFPSQHCSLASVHNSSRVMVAALNRVNASDECSFPSDKWQRQGGERRRGRTERCTWGG